MEESSRPSCHVAGTWLNPATQAQVVISVTLARNQDHTFRKQPGLDLNLGLQCAKRMFFIVAL